MQPMHSRQTGIKLFANLRKSFCQWPWLIQVLFAFKDLTAINVMKPGHRKKLLSEISKLYSTDWLLDHKPVRPLLETEKGDVEICQLCTLELHLCCSVTWLSFALFKPVNYCPIFFFFFNLGQPGRLAVSPGSQSVLPSPCAEWLRKH